MPYMGTPRPCQDYQRHELWCHHQTTTKRRWQTADGCEGTACDECYFATVASWFDLREIAIVDRWGLPIDPKHDRLGDAIGRMLVSKLQRPERGEEVS